MTIPRLPRPARPVDAGSRTRGTLSLITANPVAVTTHRVARTILPVRRSERAKAVVITLLEVIVDWEDSPGAKPLCWWNVNHHNAVSPACAGRRAGPDE